MSPDTKRWRHSVDSPQGRFTGDYHAAIQERFTMMLPNKTVETNRRPASPFEAEQPFGSASCALRVLSAAVAHLCRSASHST